MKTKNQTPRSIHYWGTLFVFLFLMAGIFSSCKKEACECPEDEPTAMELLTDGAWTYVKDETYQNGTLVSQNTFHCDEIEFTKSGNYYIYYHGRLDRYGTYTLTAGDPPHLITHSNGNDYDHVIEVLEKNKLQYTYSNDTIVRKFYYER